MGALSKLRSLVTTQHVPESGNTRIATGAMKSSATALTVVAKGNQQGSTALTLAVNTIGQKHFTQAAGDRLAQELGLIEGWADQQVLANKIITSASGHYTRGTKAMNDSAKKIATANQTVALDSATTQHGMARDHVATSMQVAMKQSAYGGAGWSA